MDQDLDLTGAPGGTFQGTFVMSSASGLPAAVDIEAWVALMRKLLDAERDAEVAEAAALADTGDDEARRAAVRGRPVCP